MGGNLAGNDALLYVVQVGQGQVLGGGYIAQEGRTVHGGNGTADGSRDVVVAGGDVGDQRSKHIEGGTHADGLLHLHVGSDLIHGHMAGAFHHDLHVLLPGALGQLAQAHQLFNLAHVGGIGQAAGAAGIAQRDGHIVLAADVQNFIVIFIEGVFVAGHAHPGKHQRTAAGDDVHLALMAADLVNGLAGDAAVQGHKVHTVLCVQPHYVNEILGGEGGQVALVMNDAVVDRHGADHGGAFGGELFAEGLGVAVAGKVHDGLSAHIHGAHHLLHFHVVILAVPAHTQVHVDFGAQHGANALGVQAGVRFVGGDDHLALRHQSHQFVHRQLLFLGNGLHLRGHDALAGRVHLGGVNSV